MIELWKPLEEFEEQYEISNHGRLRTLDPRYFERVMKYEIDRGGYYVIKLRKFGIVTKAAIHRLTYLNWKGDIPSGHVVHHIDENKLNNAINNLMLLTVSEHRALHNKGVKPIYVTLKNLNQS